MSTRCGNTVRLSWEASRKLFAALALPALLLAAPSKARAEDIPAEFWGGWCDTVSGPALNSVDPEKYSRSSARACPADRIWIAVSGDGYRVFRPSTRRLLSGVDVCHRSLASSI